MNLKEISIQKLMKATFAVLIGLSIFNTLVMLGAGTRAQALHPIYLFWYQLD